MTNHTQSTVKKCLGCRCLRDEDEFVYGNKINKSCLKCRDKRKKNREPKTNTIKPNEEPKDNDLIRYIRHQRLFRKINNEFLQQKAKKNEQVTTVETNNDKDPTRYITHQKVFRKLNNEFLERAGKSVHIYEMKYVFVDIRDHRIYSDKDFTYTNY